MADHRTGPRAGRPDDDACPGAHAGPHADRHFDLPSGFPGPRTDRHDDESAGEYELRVLLERAVPQLAAPARRLADVQERVRRRARRRRTVYGAGFAVVAAASAGLLTHSLTAGPAPAEGARTPAAAPPTAPAAPPAASGPQVTTAAPSPDDGAGVRRFDALAGLTLRVPRGWYVLAPAGSSTVWLSTQPLILPDGHCTRPRDGFCTPLVRMLGPGAVLVQMQVRIGPAGTAHKAVDHPGVVPQDVLSACRAVGGIDQLGATLTDSADSASAWAVACLAGPGADQRAATRALLTTAEFT